MKNTLKCFGSMAHSTWMLAAGVLLASSAHADISYTQETRMNEEQSSKAPTTVTVRSVSPEGERTEMRSQYGKMQVNQTTLLLCKKNQEIQLDTGLKIYWVKPLNETATTKEKSGKKTEEKTGKIISTYSVKDLGEERILDLKTRHYLATTSLDFSGCVGDKDMETKVEVWVSDIKDATPCAQTFDHAVAYSAFAEGDCKITFEQKGDVEAYGKIYSGIILRQKTYMGDKLLMTQEVTNLSQAKLNAELFAIPADYKKVTPEDFQTQQSAAMMRAMMAADMPIGE